MLRLTARIHGRRRRLFRFNEDHLPIRRGRMSAGWIFRRQDSCGEIRFIDWEYHKKTGYDWWIQQDRTLFPAV